MVFNIGEKKPREIYLNACSEIGAAFSKYGFKYVKSGPKLHKKINDLIFEFNFSSSHFNGKNYMVALDSILSVGSLKLKSWRKGRAEHTALSGHCLASTIFTGDDFSRRNLIEKDPHIVTSEIIVVLLDSFNHYLSVYDEDANFLDFSNSDFPITGGVEKVQYYLAHDRFDLAKDLAEARLASSENVRKSYIEAYRSKDLATPPPPNFNFDLGYGLAYYSVLYNWGILS